MHKPTRTTSLTALLLLLILLWPAETAHAWLRAHIDDATIAQRAQLIVVGHLELGSIERIMHDHKPDEGRSWEHHATLVVTEVIKGQTKQKKLPIILHYGLTPTEQGGDQAAGEPDRVITIRDTGNSAMSFTPMVANANADQLWFLSKRSGTFVREPGNPDGKFGIVDPEEVQPTQWKDYFRCYLAEDAEAAINQHLADHPEHTERAKPYLDDLAITRALAIEDPAERFENLLPYYLDGDNPNNQKKVRDGIIATGKAATPRLIQLFDDPQHAGHRRDIISLWSKIGDPEVVPILIRVLEEHDTYWARQDLQKGWWNTDVASDLTQQRRTLYGEVYCGVCALKSINDPRARPTIQITRDRWAAINFDNKQIVEACDEALKTLPAPRGLD